MMDDAATTLTCQSCFAAAPFGARFCPDCGKVLETQKPQHQGSDKRILTLIFVDLSGSTKLAETSGLERYDEVLQVFHNEAADIIGAFGGVVVQHFGDGLLAAFGLRKDGEDAALAGLAAGLAMTRDMPAKMGNSQLRVGIHSGEVICRIGSSGEYFPQVTGFDVNLTSRIQEQASIGTVKISAETRGFVERLAQIDSTDSGLVTMKGVSRPINLYEVSGFDFITQPVRSGKLLERDGPLDTITNTFGKYLVVGPAGIGKSSFLEALRAKVSDGDLVISLAARSNLTRSPFVPILDWIRANVARDGADTLGANLTHLGVNLAPLQLAHIGALITRGAIPPQALDLAPLQLRAAQIEAVTALMVALLSKGAWLFYDDFHWTDDNTKAVIAAILANPLPANSRLVLLSRPYTEVLDFAAERDLTQIKLQPLSVEAARSALTQTHGRLLATAQINDIVKTAAGNPLYLSSLAASTDFGDSDTASLPQSMKATLQSVINRYDNLRPMIEAASVLGDFFTVKHLGILTPDRAHLTDEIAFLQLSGLLQQQDDGYAFAQPLYREAAYEMITGQRRRGLHQHLAQQLQLQDPEFCQIYPELLADHAIASHDATLIPATCIGAGSSFLRRASFDAAIRYFDAAIAALKLNNEIAPELRETYLAALSLLASTQVQKYGFAHDLVRDSYNTLDGEIDLLSGGEMVRMLALYGLFAHRMISGKVRDCRPMLRRMEQTAPSGNSTAQVLTLVNNCAFGLYSGRFDYAINNAAQLDEVYDAADHGGIFLDVGADPFLSVNSAKVHILFQRGQADQARALMTQADAHADALGATLQKPWLDVFGAASMFFGGFPGDAFQSVAKGIDMADQQGAAFWQLMGRIWQSTFMALSDQPAAGRAGLEAMLPQAQGAGIGLSMPAFLSAIAHGCLAENDLATALTHTTSAIGFITKNGDGTFAPLAYKTHAEILDRMGSTDQSARARQLAALHTKRSGAVVWDDLYDNIIRNRASQTDQ
ncbi:MAG: class 3 adenylate cyclase/tetratricopeptide (TPR) repeat protein [Gammaproteobacteria bacterium]|jgi:class 3 adenylate cyclase/tetratricopeptide (TPR) repeat protein